MKLRWYDLAIDTAKSHPARGAWIEIANFACLRQRGRTSHPARGAWIEMIYCATSFATMPVAPRKGCVD